VIWQDVLPLPATKLTGAESREFLEIVDQVRLVEITAFHGNPGPVRGGYAPDQRPGPLEAPDSVVLLRGHSDLRREHLDEPALGEADLAGDVPNFHRLVDSLQRCERSRDGGVLLRGSTQSREERLLEEREPMRWRGRLAEPLPDLGGGRVPEVGQIHVGVAQLYGGEAEEGVRATRPKVHADDIGMYQGIDYEVTAVGAGDNGSGELSTTVRIRRIVDADLVIAQVDDKLDGPAGQNPLPWVWWRVGAEPEAFDESIQRRSRFIGMVEHSLNYERAFMRCSMRSAVARRCRPAPTSRRVPSRPFGWTSRRFRRSCGRHTEVLSDEQAGHVDGIRPFNQCMGTIRY
jgi:hypothetical protein